MIISLAEIYLFANFTIWLKNSFWIMIFYRIKERQDVFYIFLTNKHKKKTFKHRDYK